MRSNCRIAIVFVAMTFGLLMSGGPANGAPQMDARITALADQMNLSVGEAKTAAMAALLNALVEQHKTMSVKPEASKPMCMDKSTAPATASPASPDSPAHDHSAK